MINSAFFRLKSLPFDFYIRTTDNQLIGTHKIVLILVSEVLADLLTSNLSNENELELCIDSKDLRMILDFIYEKKYLELSDLDQYHNLLKWLRYFLINIDAFLPVYVNLPYNLFLQLRPEDHFVGEDDSTHFVSYTRSLFQELKDKITDLRDDIKLQELFTLHKKHVDY